MRYYIDTEFLEGPQKKRFLGMPYGETKPTIDLISIGIVAEDGREYYAISKDFNLKEAWDRYDIKKCCETPIMCGCYIQNECKGFKKEYWIRDNVLKPIFKDLWETEKGALLIDVDWRSGIFNYKSFKEMIDKYGKTNKQIAEEIIEFTDHKKKRYNEFGEFNLTKPELYAYYADYDWVAFCWLFGKMINLPKGFPKYCIDLKQEMDKIVFPLLERENAKQKFLKGEEYSFEEGLRLFKTRSDYPKQTNEHNALADARWNKELHEFLKTI